MENSFDFDQSEGHEPTREEKLIAICKGWQKMSKLSVMMLMNMDVSFKATVTMLWIQGRMNGQNAVDTMAVSAALTAYIYVCRKKIIHLFAKWYVSASNIIPLSKEMLEHDEQQRIEEVLTKFPAILPALNQAAE